MLTLERPRPTDRGRRGNRPALVAGPAQRGRRRRRRSATSSTGSIPATRARSTRTHAATRRDRAPRPRDRGLHRPGAGCDRRKLVTSHDALGYYADRYGIEVIGAAIPALSTQAQASAGETADLVDLIRAEGVAADLPRGRRQPRPRGGDRIGGRGPDRRRSCGRTRSGPEGSAASTYLGSLRSNTEAIVDGLHRRRVRCRLP